MGLFDDIDLDIKKTCQEKLIVEAEARKKQARKNLVLLILGGAIIYCIYTLYDINLQRNWPLFLLGGVVAFEFLLIYRLSTWSDKIGYKVYNNREASLNAIAEQLKDLQARFRILESKLEHQNS